MRPFTLQGEFGEFMGGKCPCGTVFVCDPTGHEAGQAYTEALAFAKGDWNFETLDPEIDYTMEDMDYDFKNHTQVSSHRGGLCGKLVFVKLKGTQGGPAEGEGSPPQESGGGERKEP